MSKSVAALTAGEVMTSPALTVSPQENLYEAVRLMLEHAVSGLLVIDREGLAIGMLTEGDLLRRVELGTAQERSWLARLLAGPQKEAAEYLRTHERRVGDVMTRGVIGVDEDTSLAEVVETLASRGIKRVAVLRGGRPLGVIGQADLLRILLDQRPKPTEAKEAEEDTVLKARLGAALLVQPWVPAVRLRWDVVQGVAHLWGEVQGATVHAALRALAESVPGIRHVADHLLEVDLDTGTPPSSPPERPAG